MAKVKKRCPWANPNNPLYIEYHDKEWGRPIHDDNHFFEMVTLEGAQAGLSWETVLNKRAHYYKVFKGFDPKKVARLKQPAIEKLLLDPGIIRNRLKVESTVSNAKAFLAIQKEFGSFDKYIWGFVDGKPVFPKKKILKIKDFPSKTELSDTVAKDLKKRGFRFMGSTIVYAFLQATGLVNDHTADCFRYKKK